MLYTVTGADRTTGKDVNQTIDARSSAEAESIASLTMLVSKVTAVAPAAPVPVVPANDLEAAVLEVAAKPQVGYARPSKRDRGAGVDWSAGLANGAWFLRIVSWPVAASAIPFFLLAFKDLLNSIYISGIEGILRFLSDSFIQFVLALALLATAGFLRIVAHAALALRHLATPPQPEPPESEIQNFKSQV
jgi:hypothetical protein